jgi:uncharacterized membrane protein YqaE (UPF0057 family)
MRYLLAILCPPIAVLMCGKLFQGLILSPLLTLCFWVPGIIHACCVVGEYNRRQRLEELAVIAGASRRR